MTRLLFGFIIPILLFFGSLFVLTTLEKSGKIPPDTTKRLVSLNFNDKFSRKNGYQFVAAALAILIAIAALLLAIKQPDIYWR